MNQNSEFQTNWDEYQNQYNFKVNSGYTDYSQISPYIGKRVLDVGCSYGIYLNNLKTDTNCEIFGIDPSEVAIAEAKKNFPDGNFFVGRAEALPWPNNYFDTVICLEVVEHLPNPERFFNEVVRILKNNGYLVVQTPNYPVKRIYDLIHLLQNKRKNIKDDSTHISRFTIRRLSVLARSTGFEIIALNGRNIIGENIFPFLRDSKKNKFGRCLAQKIILVAKKS